MLSDQPSEGWIAEIFVTGEADDVEKWFDSVTDALEDGPVQFSAAGLRPDIDEED